MPLVDELSGAGTLNRSLLSVRGNDGDVIGLAFLITDTVAFTCAHVVNTATGTPRGVDVTGESVELEAVFGSDTGDTAAATVEHWSAEARPRQAADDIAVLRLRHPVAGTGPVRLQNPSGPHGTAQVRAYGIPAGRPRGVWHAGTLHGVVASGWIQINQSADAGYRIERGFSGGPVWDEAQRAVVGMITVADLGTVRAAYAIPSASLLAAVPALHGELRQPSPYPGLVPYPETMREAFLGREPEARDVADLLGSERWVTISGPSGSGKSSLLLAGVVPRLRDRGDHVVVVRPDGDGGPSVAHRPGERTGGNRTVVAVDQLEGVFSLADEDRDAFIQALFGDGLPSHVRVVATLRHDFLGQSLAHPTLRRAVQGRRMYPLGPLQEDGLRTVVTRTDARVSVPQYEDGLVDRIVADARASAAPMPLLSHTLATLWDGSPGSVLTHRAYDAAGGVGGALDQAVRGWLDEVPVELEEHLPHLLAKLVRLPSDTAEPTRRPVNATALPEPERDLARRLTTAGLLVAGGSLDPADWSDETGERAVFVELAHDSLFRTWGLLGEFVEDNRSFLVWSERLRFDAERWADGDRERAELLPSDAELDAAARWEAERGADLTATQRAYLAAGRSSRAARTRRRHRLFGGAATVGVVLVALITVLAASSATSAEQQRRTTSRTLAESAAEIKRTDPSLGILASVAAWRTAPTAEARDRLLSQYIDYSDFARVLPAGLGSPDEMAHSADGDVVATISAYGRLTLHVNVLSGAIRTANVTDQSRIQSVAVTADGRRVVAFRDDETAFWFGIDRDAPSLHGPVHRLENAGGRVPKPADPPQPVWSSYQHPFTSPDGRYAVARVWNRFVRWDIASGRIVNVTPASDDTEFDVWAGSPDAATLIMPVITSAKADRSDAVELNLTTGKSRVVARGGESLGGWLLSGDDGTLIRCRKGHSTVEYSRLRVADGAELGKPIEYHSTQCLMDATDRTGRFALVYAIATSPDGRAVIDFAKGKMVADFPVPATWTNAMAGHALAERGGRYYELGATDDGATGYIAAPIAVGPSIGNEETFSDQVLLGGGAHSVGITDETGIYAKSADHLIQLRSTDEPGRLISQVEVRKSGWLLGDTDGIRAAPTGGLIADREGRNIVVVRDAATLRKRATVHAVPAPDDGDPSRPLVRDLTGNSGTSSGGSYEPSLFSYFFDAAGNLVTISGNVVQIWQARTGSESSRLDLSRTRPRGARKQPSVVAPAASPGTVAVTYPDARATRVINIAAGKVVTDLPTGPETVSVQFDPAGKYLLLYRGDNTVEVRDATARRTIVGPVQAGDDANFVARFIGGDRFMLGADNRAQIYDLRSGAQTDSYRFGGTSDSGLDSGDALGTVLDVSSHGERVIYQRAEGPPLVVPLDPDRWQRALCAVAGDRDLNGRLDYLTSGARIPRNVCG